MLVCLDIEPGAFAPAVRGGAAVRNFAPARLASASLSHLGVSAITREGGAWRASAHMATAWLSVSYDAASDDSSEVQTPDGPAKAFVDARMRLWTVNVSRPFVRSLTSVALDCADAAKSDKTQPPTSTVEATLTVPDFKSSLGMLVCLDIEPGAFAPAVRGGAAVRNFAPARLASASLSHLGVSAITREGGAWRASAHMATAWLSVSYDAASDDSSEVQTPDGPAKAFVDARMRLWTVNVSRPFVRSLTSVALDCADAAKSDKTQPPTSTVEATLTVPDFKSSLGMLVCLDIEPGAFAPAVRGGAAVRNFAPARLASASLSHLGVSAITREGGAWRASAHMATAWLSVSYDAASDDSSEVQTPDGPAKAFVDARMRLWTVNVSRPFVRSLTSVALDCADAAKSDKTQPPTSTVEATLTVPDFKSSLGMLVCLDIEPGAFAPAVRGGAAVRNFAPARLASASLSHLGVSAITREGGAWRASAHMATAWLSVSYDAASDDSSEVQTPDGPAKAFVDARMRLWTVNVSRPFVRSLTSVALDCADAAKSDKTQPPTSTVEATLTVPDFKSSLGMLVCLDIEPGAFAPAVRGGAAVRNFAPARLASASLSHLGVSAITREGGAWRASAHMATAWLSVSYDAASDDSSEVQTPDGPAKAFVDARMRLWTVNVSRPFVRSLTSVALDCADAAKSDKTQPPTSTVEATLTVPDFKSSLGMLVCLDIEPGAFAPAVRGGAAVRNFAPARLASASLSHLGVSAITREGGAWRASAHMATAWLSVSYDAASDDSSEVQTPDGPAKAFVDARMRLWTVNVSRPFVRSLTSVALDCADAAKSDKTQPPTSTVEATLTVPDFKSSLGMLVCLDIEPGAFAPAVRGGAAVRNFAPARLASASLSHLGVSAITREGGAWRASAHMATAWLSVSYDAASDDSSEVQTPDGPAKAFVDARMRLWTVNVSRPFVRSLTSVALDCADAAKSDKTQPPTSTVEATLTVPDFKSSLGPAPPPLPPPPSSAETHQARASARSIANLAIAAQWEGMLVCLDIEPGAFAPAVRGGAAVRNFAPARLASASLSHLGVSAITREGGAWRASAHMATAWLSVSYDAASDDSSEVQTPDGPAKAFVDARMRLWTVNVSRPFVRSLTSVALDCADAAKSDKTQPPTSTVEATLTVPDFKSSLGMLVCLDIEPGAFAPAVRGGAAVRNFAPARLASASLSHLGVSAITREGGAWRASAHMATAWLSVSYDAASDDSSEAQTPDGPAKAFVDARMRLWTVNVSRPFVRSLTSVALDCADAAKSDKTQPPTSTVEATLTVPDFKSSLGMLVCLDIEPGAFAPAVRGGAAVRNFAPARLASASLSHLGVSAITREGGAWRASAHMATAWLSVSYDAASDDSSEVQTPDGPAKAFVDARMRLWTVNVSRPFVRSLTSVALDCADAAKSDKTQPPTSTVEATLTVPDFKSSLGMLVCLDIEPGAFAPAVRGGAAVRNFAPARLASASLSHLGVSAITREGGAWRASAHMATAWLSVSYDAASDDSSEVQTPDGPAKAFVDARMRLWTVNVSRPFVRSLTSVALDCADAAKSDKTQPPTSTVEATLTVPDFKSSLGMLVCLDIEPGAFAPAVRGGAAVRNFAPARLASASLSHLGVSATLVRVPL
ncbi:hypothetical protein PPROV_000011800 [Pycnococcus provasolii]|uniref:Uncharacterized protein n=1 Tax=Pycnococcus provasolii TaxID=41880 RepID=A0A830H4B5_9CHLO|nr:hypothetical protein PPROV_000011800 [Pycnococcus provasolii]